MSAMLDVSNALKYPGQVYSFELGVEIEEMEVLSDPVAFSNVAVRGEFFGSGEQVSIRGEITSTVTSRCAKCLEPVVLELSARRAANWQLEKGSAGKVPEAPDVAGAEEERIQLIPFGSTMLRVSQFPVIGKK